MKITVVIPSHNRREHLMETIKSLLRQKFPKKDYEIIVVSDSVDGTEEMVNDIKKTSPVSIRFFRKVSDGPSQKRNVGIKHAKGKFVAFIDDDCIAQPEWIKGIFDAFSNNCGGVEGRTVTDKAIGPFSHYIHNRTGGHYMTCNMAYRKDLLDKIGGFDEKFTTPVTINREDSDLAFSVLERGYEIAFSKIAVVKHPAVRASFTNRLKKKKEFFVDPLLFKKHPILYRKKIKFPFELFTPLYIILTILTFLQIYFIFGLILLAFFELNFRSWKVGVFDFVKFIILQTIGSFVIVIYYIYGCINFRVNPLKPLIHV